MEVLPGLVSRDDAINPLPSAIRALAVSMAAAANKGWAPIPDALEAQGSALNALRSAIPRSTASPSNELAVSTMCMFFSEVSRNPFQIQS